MKIVAISTSLTASQKTNIHDYDSCSSPSNETVQYIIPTNTDQLIVPLNSYKTFNLQLSKEINLSEINCTDLEITSFNNNILTIRPEKKFSCLSFNGLNNEYTTLLNKESTGNLKYKTLYFFEKDNRISISSSSIDSAIENIVGSSITENSPLSVKPETPDYPNYPWEPYPSDTYCGILKWEDDQGNIYPLVGAKVSMDTQIGKTINCYTNQEGMFCISVLQNRAKEETLNFSLSGENIRVNKVNNNNDNKTIGIQRRSSTYSFSLSQYIESFKNKTKSEQVGSICISSIGNTGYGSDFGRATQIFQSLVYYSNYAKSLKKGSMIPFCNAYYPCEKDYDNIDGNVFPNIDIAFCRKKLGLIFPAESQPIDSLNVYESWDLIGHEYGHFILDKLNLLKLNSGGYPHYSDRDDINELIMNGSLQTKQQAINAGLSLAWTESFPTYWSEIAQQSFPMNIREHYYEYQKGSEKTHIVGNRYYEAYNFSPSKYYSLDENVDFKNIKSNYPIGGEAYEPGLINALYAINRLFGDLNANQIPTKDYLWEILLDFSSTFYSDNSQYQMTFSDFYNYIYEQMWGIGSYNNVSAEDFFNVMQDYWIAPIRIEISNKSSSQFTLQWKIGGNMDIVPLSNCNASLNFFDENGVVFSRKRLSLSKKKDNMYCWFYSVIDSSSLHHSSIENVMVGLTFSPNVYDRVIYDSDGDIDEEIKYQTGPYTRIIWKGKDSEMTIENLSNIVISKY